MDENKLQILVEVVNKANAQLEEIKKKIGELQPELTGVADASDKASLSTGKLITSFTVGSLAATAITKGLELMKNAVVGAISGVHDLGMQAAAIQELEMAMQILAKNMGVNEDKAFEARDAVAALNISNKEATMFINELIRSNIDLANAEKAVKAARDLGIGTGMGSAEVLGRLAQAMRTGNTMILDQVVNLPNLDQIYRRYAATIGVSANALNQNQKSQAILNAFMDEGAKKAGLYETSLTGAQKAAVSFQTSQQRLGEAIGYLFLPALDAIYPALYKFSKGLESWVNDNRDQIQRAGEVIGNYVEMVVQKIEGLIKSINIQDIMAIAGAVIDALARVAHQALMLWETVKLVANGIGMVVEQMNGLAQSVGQVLSGQISVGQALERSADLFSARANDMKKNVEGIWNNAKSSGESFTESFKKQMANVTVSTRKELNLQGGAWKDTYEDVKNTVGKKLGDITKKMETENKNFMRTMEQSTAAFNNKLKDLVIRHREAANQLRDDINSLTGDYTEAQAERATEHGDRVQEIKDASEEEIESLRRNLLLQLSESHRSDEDLKAMLEAQIAEKERLRDEEIAKEEAKFQKETEKQKKQYEQRLKELQEKLSAEMEIQKAHQAEFDAIKDQAAEDDITRLKNEFAAEMEMRRQQHAERMDELKKEYEEIQKVKASGDSSISGRGAINQSTPTIPKSTSATYKPSSSSALSSYNAIAAATGGKTLNLTQNNTVNNGGDISAMMNSIGWLFKGL